MREKPQAFPLAELRELAKSGGIKGISNLRKTETIELLCAGADRSSETKPVGMKKKGRRQPPVQGGALIRSAEPQSRQESDPSGSAELQSKQESRQDNTSSGNTELQDRQENGAQEPQGIRSREPRNQEPKNRDSKDQENRNQESRNQNPRRSMNRSCESNKYSSFKPQMPRQHTGGGQDQGSCQQNSENRGRSFRQDNGTDAAGMSSQDTAELSSGVEAGGVLGIMLDEFGFIRYEDFLPGENGMYMAPSQVRHFNLKVDDIIVGNRRVKSAAERSAALLYIKTVNGCPFSATETRPNLEDLTPIFPNKRPYMRMPGIKTPVAMRMVDLPSPIGKGQRGVIISPPKAGETTLLGQVIRTTVTNHSDTHLMVPLISERPEEMAGIRKVIVGLNVEVIYSTFDELPDRYERMSEMVIRRVKRLMEHGCDVVIPLDSITCLARARNLAVAPGGCTLPGDLDPAVLHMPKRFFGAARNMREGGNLTVLATVLVDTGSRMDDVVYEKFKGTDNMELVLDRKLSEKRAFPTIDTLELGTRRDDLLLSRKEVEAADVIHKATSSLKSKDTAEKVLDLFARTRNNRKLVENAKRVRFC